MKRFLFVIVLFITACGVIPPGPTSVAEEMPSIPEAPPSETLDPFLYPSNTPTLFSSATQTPTSIPVIETSVPLTWTPIPTPSLRMNTPLPPGGAVSVTSIQMIDSQNGWGFDADWHVLRTRDGGMTWQDVTPPQGNFLPSGFFALNAERAWATFRVYTQGSFPTTAYVWRTTDGGRTWTPSQEFRLDLDQDGSPYSAEFYLPNGMQFIDTQTGWLLADVSYGMNSARPLFFRTEDGGESWTTINSRHGFPGTCVEVGFAFLDSQTGWAGGNCFLQGVISNKLSFFLSPDGWTISKTTDGGYSYEQKTTMPIPTEFLRSDLLEQESNCGENRIIPIAPSVIGMEWGCNLFAHLGSDYNYFALSSDGGQTWNSWKSSGNEFFLDARLGWRLLAPGELQQTTNGGLEWVTIKTVAWEAAQFDFVNAAEGWAIASSGELSTLLHTTNGGITWMELKPVIVP